MCRVEESNVRYKKCIYDMTGIGSGDVTMIIIMMTEIICQRQQQSQ